VRLLKSIGRALAVIGIALAALAVIGAVFLFWVWVFGRGDNAELIIIATLASVVFLFFVAYEYITMEK